ncbi:MAG TPA: substrate-binding domain-containing protein [Candidatus Limnocylindrales bacterium]|nr:substrate-binding domain-containing protein [Candidatus Limnocylindrales bacterium]
MDEKANPKGISRRSLIKGAAAAATVPVLASCVGAQSGASATPAASTSGGASASPKKLSGTLSILQWSHFVPDFDTYLDKWAADWGSKNGVTVKIDRIPQADLPARFATEVASKSGHDLVAHFANGLPALFTDSLVDITDIADRAATKYGGWLPAGEAIGKVKGKWYGYPDFLVPFLSAWRTDLWKAAGFTKDHLETWEDLIAMAPKLKAAGNPVGTAVSQTSDSEHTWRSLMWSHGAYEFSQDGKTIAIDSPETRSVLNMAKTLYASMENSTLSWADVDNNTYLQSGKGSWIYNPISAYRTIEAQNKELAAKINIENPLKGTKAQIASIQFTVYGIWNFSKNIDAARQFLIDYSDDWEGQFTASKGYNNPFLKGHQKKPMPILGADAKLTHLQDIANFVQPVGYPGPSSQAAYDALNNHHVTDMFSNFLTGKKSADDAIAEAKKRLQDSLTKFPV